MADYETPSFAVTIDVPVTSCKRFYLAGIKPVCDKGQNKVYMYCLENIMYNYGISCLTRC